jgi:multiple sugar transport system permease protein
MTTVAQPASVARRIRRWEGLPYWLVLPTIAYLLLFFGWPMVEAFTLAFREDSGVWSLDAFERMVDDLRFGEALKTTLILIVVIIPLQFALAVAMALLVNAKLRLRGLFLYIFLLPLAISDLAAGIVWSSIFTERGYLNTILQHLGIGDPNIPRIWLDPTDQTTLLGTIVVAEIWRSTALIMIILVAGLQAIPKEFNEAAEVFGAGFWQRLRTITLPMLKPSIQVALLLRVILAFEVFSTVIAIAGEGTTVLAAEAYRWETTNQDENVAAAYASLILVLSVVSALIVLRLLRTKKEQLLR